MGCDLLDLRCIFVSELAGDAVMAMLIGAIIYFITASKLRWGFDTTVVFMIPALLIFGLSITGFSIMYAFITVLAGLFAAWIFNIVTGNR